jgi:hypothetical protein
MNKQRIAILLAGLACLFAIFAAPASAFTEFRAKTPTTFKVANKGKSTFGVTGAAAPVECGVAAGSGVIKKVVKEEKKEEKKVVIKTTFSSCTAFGFISATVSPVEWEFSATGTVTLLNSITVKTAGCEVTFPSKANSELGTITYTNVAGTNKEIEDKAAVSGMTEESTGSLCGKSGKEASFQGTSIFSAAGVDLEVI